MRTRLIRQRHSGCPPRGGTLIEVLVSVLVLAIGLLGAAAVHTAALRNNQSNYEHAQMTLLTQGMFDAMRSNIAGVTGGAYEMASWTCTAPSAGTLAGDDIAAWIGDLQAQINPGACGRITCTARDCTVGIQWDDTRATGGASAHSIEVRGRL